MKNVNDFEVLETEEHWNQNYCSVTKNVLQRYKIKRLLRM